MNGFDDGKVPRIMPQSGLDFNMMLTDTMWGSSQISTQLKEKVHQRDSRRQLLHDIETGVLRENPEGEQAAAWELLSFYTRDLRLANLNMLTGEVQYCQHYIDLAGDCLREGYMEAFATSLARAATLLELSQSKGGFLRRRQNTLTTESLQGDLEPQKKRLLFGGKKNQG